MAGKLTLMVGLPGSGKSTIAQSMVESSTPGSTVRVNRDDIRTTLFGEEYHKGDFPAESESQVTEVQQGLIKGHLLEGKHVVSDDTNLSNAAVEPLYQIAKNHDAELDMNYVDVPVDECKRRNHLRGEAGGRLVPDFVIDRMASKGYDRNGNLKEIVFGSNGKASFVSKNTRGSKLISDYNKKAVSQNPINSRSVVFVDLDGTLANNSRDLDKAFGVPGKRRDFHRFHKASEHAPVNENVLRLVKDMRSDNLNIFALSGRTDQYARETIAFLERSGAPISRLILKREGDFRPDIDFKLEVLENLQKEGLAVVHAIDDRPQVITMWENAGIVVSKVPYHEPVDPATGPTSYSAPEVQTIFGTGVCIRCGQTLKDGGNIGPVCRTKIIL